MSVSMWKVLMFTAVLVAAAGASSAQAQTTRDPSDSPFLSYPPQGVCSTPEFTGVTYWICEITALPDGAISELSEDPGWRVSWFTRASDSAATDSSDVFDLGGQDEHDITIGCVPVGTSGVVNVCTSANEAEVLSSKRVEFTPLLRDTNSMITAGDLPFQWLNIAEPAMEFEVFFGDQPPVVLDSAVVRVSGGAYRLVLAIDPPLGVQQTQVDVEDTVYTLQTDVTQTNPPNFFNIQAPLGSSPSRALTFRIRGRNYGGTNGLIIRDPDQSNMQVGFTPANTFGYTPWSQPFAVRLAVEDPATDSIRTPMPAHPMAEEAVRDIWATSRVQEPAESSDAPEVLNVLSVGLVAIVIAAGVWFPCRGAGLAGALVGVAAGLLVWAVLGPAVAGISTVEAWAPLTVPAAAGVLAVVRVFR